MLARAEKGVDLLHPARMLDQQVRKMDERLPAIFLKLGPTADPAKLAQF
jgi:hypothetical protein